MNSEKITFAPLIVGTMRLGIWGSKYNQSEYERFIDNCLDLNLTDFDHADIYGSYTTESEFGAVLSNRKDLRGKVEITTKCGIQYPSDARPKLNVKHYDFSAKHIIQSVENSLRNLQVENIKLLLLHRPDYLMEPASIARTFEQLQQQGKVQHFGVSNFTPTQFDLLNSHFPLVNNQIEISLLKPKALLNDHLFHFVNKAINITAWSPLGGGQIFDKNQPTQLKTLLKNLSKKYHCQIDQLLFAWLNKHPANITAVTGTSKIERIKRALEAQTIQLSQEDWYALLEKSVGQEVA